MTNPNSESSTAGAVASYPIRTARFDITVVDLQADHGRRGRSAAWQLEGWSWFVDL